QRELARRRATHDDFESRGDEILAALYAPEPHARQPEVRRRLGLGSADLARDHRLDHRPALAEAELAAGEEPRRLADPRAVEPGAVGAAEVLEPPRVVVVADYPA